MLLPFAIPEPPRVGENWTERILGLVDRGELLFVLVHAASILCAGAFYLVKNRQLFSSDTMHKIASGLGVAFIAAIFGFNVLYMLLQVGLAWMILRCVRDSKAAAIIILMDSMAILCYLQVKRIRQMDLSTVDFTAPLMISTQKLTSLAFSLHDHTLAQDAPDSLPEENRRLMVAKRPSLLQLASYVFFFHGVVVGPLSFYADYIYFMEEQPANFKAKGRKRTLARHLALTLVLAGAVVALAPRLPPHLLLEPAQSLPFPLRVGMTYLVMMVARLKYYFAWNLGSCIQLAAGYGYDRQRADWAGIKNVSILGLELATSPKAYIDAWNTGTNTWLRLVAHSRLPPRLKMPGTFVLSAMWHGFYPGYYFTFLFAIPMTLAARRVRRLLRPRFLAAGRLPLYHAITWAGTQLILAYTVVPFTLLHLDLVLSYYQNTMRWAGHAVLLALLAATFLLPPAGGPSSKPGRRGADATAGSADPAQDNGAVGKKNE